MPGVETPVDPAPETQASQQPSELALEAAGRTGENEDSSLSDVPTGLGERLARGELDSSGAAAITELFRRWGLPAAESTADACAAAEAEGVKCLSQRGSWSMLEMLDRPAVLTLTDVNGNRHQAVLQSVNHGTAELSFGDERIELPVSEVADLWFGQYLLAWRPRVGNGTAIRPGTRGAGVLWLRQSLATINGAEELPSDDYFDQALEAEVRQFQRENRLSVDGLAGEQTQIIINSRLSPDSSPRLIRNPLSLAGSAEKH